MLLSSVILILQEMLEASLVLSVLLAFSVYHRISRRWVWPALALGIAAAGLYASQVDKVSQWYDYVGLEVTNAAIQLSLCAVLLFFSLAYTAGGRRPVPTVAWQLLMTAVVILAIAREGFEIILYGSNFAGDASLWTPVLLGGLLGGGIGISAGALLYYGLISLPPTGSKWLSLLLLALFGGNMAAQGTLLLIQADWLPSGQPLWDSDWLVSEASVLGQLLYALIGYEASPTALQAGAYGLQTLVMAALFLSRRVIEVSDNEMD